MRDRTRTRNFNNYSNNFNNTYDPFLDNNNVCVNRETCYNNASNFGNNFNTGDPFFDNQARRRYCNRNVRNSSPDRSIGPNLNNPSLDNCNRRSNDTTSTRARLRNRLSVGNPVLNSNLSNNFRKRILDKCCDDKDKFTRLIGCGCGDPCCGDCVNRFTITVTDKDGHPWEQHITDSKSAFSVNCIKGGTIHVVRGRRYVFTFLPSETLEPRCEQHRLYFTKDPVGGPKSGRYDGDFDPPSYNPAALCNTPIPYCDGSRTFVIDESFPNIFYYQCKDHQFEGGIVIVEDPC